MPFPRASGKILTTEKAPSDQLRTAPSFGGKKRKRKEKEGRGKKKLFVRDVNPVRIGLLQLAGAKNRFAVSLLGCLYYNGKV